MVYMNKDIWSIKNFVPYIAVISRVTSIIAVCACLCVYLRMHTHMPCWLITQWFWAITNFLRVIL